MGSDSNDEAKFWRSVAGAAVISGLILIAISIPATLVTAARAGRDLVATLLLLRSDRDIAALMARPNIGALDYSDASTAFALLSLYGVISLIVPLIVLVGRHEGTLKLLLLVWGMYLGLIFTSAWFEWSSTGSLQLLNATAPRIAYLYLAFLVCETLKIVVAGKGLGALPYYYLLDGLLGIVSVLIIAAGYQPSFADLLLGPFFLVAVATGLLIAEWMILRPGTIVFVGLQKLATKRSFLRSVRAAPKGRGRTRLLTTQAVAELKNARRLSYAARTIRVEEALSSVFKQTRSRPTDSRKFDIDWRWLAGSAAFNLCFPIVAAFFWWLIL